MFNIMRGGHSSAAVEVLREFGKKNLSFVVEELEEHGQPKATGLTPLKSAFDVLMEMRRSYTCLPKPKVPYYEIIPLNVIVGTCYVLDLATFCKGRPKGAKEDDIFICEYRLDKTAHVFYKISRSKYPTNTKSYCFDSFEKKLQPKRTFVPHTVPDNYKRKGSHSDTMSTTSGDLETFHSSDCDNDDDGIFKDEPKVKKATKNGRVSDTDSDEDLPLARVREKKRQQRKDRLNNILLKLLDNLPSKQAVDLTYLLDEGRGKRARKKSHLLMP